MWRFSLSDFSVGVELNVNAFFASREATFKKAQAELDTQVIKDSNLFCPEHIGTLKDSATIYSKVGDGMVGWNTPYARSLYFGVGYKFSKDKNHYARAKWLEYANKLYNERWLKIAQGAFK